MTMTVNDLLLRTCLDTDYLDQVRRDPDRALDEVGADRRIRALVTSGHGSRISLAAVRSRTLPSAEAIVDALRDRSVGDPAFVAGLIAEPITTAQRLLGIRLPMQCRIVVDPDDPADITITGLVAPTSIDTIDGAEMTDVPVIDVEVDADPSDDPVNVDTDVDVDIDTDVDVEVVDIDVEVSSQDTSRHAVYWESRHELWRSEQRSGAAH